MVDLFTLLGLGIIVWGRRREEGKRKGRRGRVEGLGAGWRAQVKRE